MMEKLLLEKVSIFYAAHITSVLFKLHSVPVRYGL